MVELKRVSQANSIGTPFAEGYIVMLLRLRSRDEDDVDDFAKMLIRTAVQCLTVAALDLACWLT